VDAVDLESAAIATEPQLLLLAETAAREQQQEDEPPLDGSYFADYRFSHFAGRYHWLGLALYFPLGMLLFALRLLASVCLIATVHLSATCRCCRCRRRRRGSHSNRGCSAHHFTVEFFRWILMSVTIVAGPTTRAARAKAAADAVLVSNHISEADFLAIASLFDVRVVAMDYLRSTPVIGRILKVADPVYIGQLSNRLSVAVSPQDTESYKAKQRETVRSAVISPSTGRHQEEAPASVLIFPEGVLTNGRKAVLRYQQFVFSLGLAVQPLAIRRRPACLQRRCFPVDHDAARVTFLSNVFWMLFMPRAHYDVMVLPQMVRREGESACDFADRVQFATASALKLRPSRFGNRDKNAFGRVHWVT
jgi:1-acyl-sn-glycerol-3-phosphate acyltransferase